MPATLSGSYTYILHRLHVLCMPPISHFFLYMCVCLCASVRMCGYKRVRQGRPCTSVCGSHDSLGWHIHLCLFAKFDFKYLSHHTSWLKQIAGKVLLSVKHVVRRMEALEGTSMFHLVKYMTGKCMCNYSTF